jgi:hypothetical protein
MSTITYAMLYKEIIGNMPDSLNSKKEVDEYFKNAMNEKNNEENKIKKKQHKEMQSKKRAKKVELVDNDGNEFVKIKRPLNKYQKFIQDNRKKVKDENPELSSEEIFTLIAKMWGKYKDDIIRIESTFKNFEDKKRVKKESS